MQLTCHLIEPTRVKLEARRTWEFRPVVDHYCPETGHAV